MRRWGAVTITWCGVWIVAAAAGKLYDSFFGLGASGVAAESLLALNTGAYFAGIVGLPIVVIGWLVLGVRAAVRPHRLKQRVPINKRFLDEFMDKADRWSERELERLRHR